MKSRNANGDRQVDRAISALMSCVVVYKDPQTLAHVSRVIGLSEGWLERCLKIAEKEEFVRQLPDGRWELTKSGWERMGEEL